MCQVASTGVSYEEVIEAGEHIPGMAALWDVATPEERREMVMLLLEPGGLYYDLEHKIIAALKPLPTFLPILRMLQGVVEYDEAKGLLVTERWQDRNRRASSPLSPVLVHFLAPHGKLYQRLSLVLSQEVQHPLVCATQRRPGPKDIPYGIPVHEWPTILQRVANQESYRKVANDYRVSRETIRRIVRAASSG